MRYYVLVRCIIKKPVILFYLTSMTLVAFFYLCSKSNYLNVCSIVVYIAFLYILDTGKIKSNYWMAIAQSKFKIPCIIFYSLCKI